LNLFLSLLGPHTRSQGSYCVIFGPKLTFLRTHRDPMDPDCFDEVKHGWELLEGTRNEWLDLFLSLLGPHTRSQGSYKVVFFT